MDALPQRHLLLAFLALLLALGPAGCDDAGRPPDGAATVGDAAVTGSLGDGGGGPGIDPDGGSPGGPLGASVDDGGVTFRLWAPHATAVALRGDFNAEAPEGTPLVAEPGGLFAAHVAAAHAGQRYRFVVTTVAGGAVSRVDPRARAVAPDGASVIVDPAAFAWSPAATAYVPPPPMQQVIYELHVGTFHPAGDTPPGTFASVAEKLDHLAALGVNMIELLPPNDFPGTFSWGYNPSLPFAVAPPYGTPDDLRRLVDAAHARGIGVIVDVVHNHYEGKTPLWCFEGDCLGKGGVYFYTDGRVATPWGPRPDFGRARVRDYVVDDALLWLSEYRADGLRWDSTVNIRRVGNVANPDGWQLLRRINDTVRGLPRATLQIAEDLQGDDTITRPTSGGGAGFSTQWDPAFFHPVDDTIIAPSDGARSMGAIRDAILHRYNGHAQERVIYTESHDEVANGKSRIPQMISPADPASLVARLRSALGAAVVMTSPGIPMLFMGQEFLEDGAFGDKRPLDWSKAITHAGTLRLYTDLVALRRNLGGTSAGLLGEHTAVTHVNDGAKVIAWHRSALGDGSPGDDVVVVANFSGRAFPVYDLGFPRGGTWHVRFHSDGKAYGDDGADTPAKDVVATAPGMDGIPYRGTVSLGAYEAIILSR